MDDGNEDELPRVRPNNLVEEAMQFRLMARRVEAVEALPRFFQTIPKLRGQLKNLKQVATKLRYIMGPTLLDGVAPGSLGRAHVLKALSDRAANFARSIRTIPTGDYDAEYCDEMDTVSVFEALPRNCKQRFASEARDVAYTLANSVHLVDALWMRTQAANEDDRDQDDDITDMLALVDLLQGRAVLDYILKFVTPEARLCFNLFAHETKVAVAACECQKTRMERMDRNRTLGGKLSKITGVLKDPCDTNAKAGGAAKKAKPAAAAKKAKPAAEAAKKTKPAAPKKKAT